jgi:hypothetical protein
MVWVRSSVKVGQTLSESLMSTLSGGGSGQAGSPLSATYEANPLDQYESVDGQAFTYDLNGNLTAYRGQTLVYSSENRLETLSGAGVEADFSYDAEGRRKRMLVGNTSTEFVHAGTMEIAEYDGDTGALLRRYIPGPGVDQRVLMITCGSSAGLRAEPVGRRHICLYGGPSGPCDRGDAHPDRRDRALCLLALWG